MLHENETMTSEKRQRIFQKNPALEGLIYEINNLLSTAEETVCRQFDQPALPVLFIVGAPRSGSTLLLQWLALSGHFSYVSNFIARFYKAPYIGAKIQQMLLDEQFAFMNEMQGPGITAHFNYQSNLGKTKGINAPSEFWYFWRRFFQFNETHKLEAEQLARVDIKRFASELAALQSLQNKPLVLKALILNWNLRFLAEHIPSVRFIHIKRHPYFNMRSLLNARRKFFGSIKQWYSFKPAEYDTLKLLDPYKQVAGQVYYTNLAVQQELEEIGGARYITVDYEEFCLHPRKTWQDIAKLSSLRQEEGDLVYMGPEKFENTNILSNEDLEEYSKIKNSYREMFDIEIDVEFEPQTGRRNEQ